MSDKEIWCCVRINTFAAKYTEDDCEILPSSIGTEEFATTFCNNYTPRGNVKKINKSEALDLIVEDILHYDNMGLRHGNWLYNAATRKLNERLGEVA